MSYVSKSDRKKRYQAYLKSPHWLELREKKMVSVDRKCERCGKKSYLQVHHISYDLFPDCPLGDLEVLCRDCHEGEHFSPKEIAPEPMDKVTWEDTMTWLVNTRLWKDGPEVARAALLMLLEKKGSEKFVIHPSYDARRASFAPVMNPRSASGGLLYLEKELIIGTYETDVEGEVWTQIEISMLAQWRYPKLDHQTILNLIKQKPVAPDAECLV